MNCSPRQQDGPGHIFTQCNISKHSPNTTPHPSALRHQKQDSALQLSMCYPGQQERGPGAELEQNVTQVCNDWQEPCPVGKGLQQRGKSKQPTPAPPSGSTSHVVLLLLNNTLHRVAEKHAFTHSNHLRQASSQINFTCDKQILHSEKCSCWSKYPTLEFEKPPIPPHSEQKKKKKETLRITSWILDKSPNIKCLRQSIFQKWNLTEQL